MGKKGATADQAVCGPRNILLFIIRTYVNTITFNLQLGTVMIPKEELLLGLWFSEDQCMSGHERFGITKKVIGVHKYLFLFCVTNGRG